MKAQRHLLSPDIISTLPADIIETILCLLPIQDAARTSILSRDWRYKWTKISKLVFNDVNFQVSTTNEKHLSLFEESFAISRQRAGVNKCRLFYAIYQVLLLHQGPINEFTLCAFTNINYQTEIDQIILHLSRRNTVKKLCLSYPNYKLPLSVFSFHKLTDLYLSECYIGLHQPTIFDGFGSLTTLHLEYVLISKITLLRLLSSCPLLKSFTLVRCCYDIDLHRRLQLAQYLNITRDDEPTLIELFECLRVIENLTICLRDIECFGRYPYPPARPRELPTSLLYLKYICIQAMYFIEKDGYGLPYLLLLIRSSPNLEKIKLQIDTPAPCYDKSEISMVDYRDIKLEHLIEFEFEIDGFTILKPELLFVRIILANSPVLKKVRIFLYKKGYAKLKLSEFLSSFPSASTEVKIIVDQPANYWC